MASTIFFFRELFSSISIAKAHNSPLLGFSFKALDKVYMAPFLLLSSISTSTANNHNSGDFGK